jgi:hypothetical protein
MKGQSSIQATEKSKNASRINEKKKQRYATKNAFLIQNVMIVNFF